jgi:hypothetical protein
VYLDGGDQIPCLREGGALMKELEEDE